MDNEQEEQDELERVLLDIARDMTERVTNPRLKTEMKEEQARFEEKYRKDATFKNV